MLRVYKKNAISFTIQQLRHFTFPSFHLNRDGIVGYFWQAVSKLRLPEWIELENQLSCLRPWSSKSHLAFILMLTDYLWTSPKGQKIVCLSHVSVSELNIIFDTCGFDSTNQTKRSKWLEDCSCESFWENVDIFQAAFEPINKKWQIPEGQTSKTCPSSGMELPGNNFPS